MFSMEEPEEWRCVCAVRILFGFYTASGGIRVIITGKHRRRAVYRFRVHWAEAHCAACHADSELQYDASLGAFTSRIARRARPLAECSVCQHGRTGADDAAAEPG